MHRTDDVSIGRDSASSLFASPPLGVLVAFSRAEIDANCLVASGKFIVSRLIHIYFKSLSECYSAVAAATGAGCPPALLPRTAANELKMAKMPLRASG